jgi:hypothetical protein
MRAAARMKNNQLAIRHRSTNPGQANKQIAVFQRDKIFAIASNSEEGVSPHHLKLATSAVPVAENIILQANSEIPKPQYDPISEGLSFRKEAKTASKSDQTRVRLKTRNGRCKKRIGFRNDTVSVSEDKEVTLSHFCPVVPSLRDGLSTLLLVDNYLVGEFSCDFDRVIFAPAIRNDNLVRNGQLRLQKRKRSANHFLFLERRDDD